MNKTPLWLYWLLLLIPALLVAGIGMRLLVHEQERVAQSYDLTLDARLQAVADDLSIAVKELQDQLTRTLLSFSPAVVEAELSALRKSNPVIRNVFVLNGEGMVQLPHPGRPADREEELFLQRYEALFAGRVPWSGDKPVEAGVAAQQLSPSAATRVDFQKLAKKTIPAAEASESVATSGAVSGWLPWFAGNQLFMLGWVRVDSGVVYGLELETTALLSRLIAVCPNHLNAGEVFQLVDGQGQVLHQAGPAEMGQRFREVAIGPLLPHWQLRLAGMENAGDGRVLLVGGLLLSILIAAIVFGGSMLLWQARRSRRDAMQKTSFVSNVSHELKTPLTTIRMYAEMLGEGRITEAGRRRDYLNTIVGESQRLTRLVNNVLDFSRLEQNRQNYRLETFDPSEVIRETISPLSERLESTGLPLSVALIAGRQVRMDRDALRQTLLNLIDNAAKYAAEGRELRIELDEKNGVLQLSVLDRGPGVPPREQERIFERFHRVDDALTAKQPGCGLGLTLARRMMRDLGGDVVYRDRPGGGAEFSIILPSTVATSPCDVPEKDS